jgi:hypothetical protein
MAQTTPTLNPYVKRSKKALNFILFIIAAHQLILGL